MTTPTPAPAVPIVERQLNIEECELRAEGDGLTLDGYAAVFNTPTRIDSWEGRFDEQFAPGAFKRSVQSRLPVLMYNHGKHPQIGDMPIGAIQTLREDARGLHVTARLFDNALVAPVRDAIAGGAIQGMSIRMQVLKETVKPGEVPLRTITEVRVPELGPVNFPAYPTTSVGVRDAEPVLADPPAELALDQAESAAPADATRATNQSARLRLAAQLEQHRKVTP